MAEPNYLKEVKSPGKLRRVLEFEVPAERVEREIGEIIRGIRREISLPGFRKGKAPIDLVRSKFGDTARKEAIERIIPEVYRSALESESLRPVMPAEISDMDYSGVGPLTFQVAIELYPDVQVADYRGLPVKRETKQVEDGDVDREIENLRLRFSTFQPHENEAQAGDVVIMDYWRLDDEGKEVAGSRVENYPVELGSGGLVKQFDEGLVGVKKGDNKPVDVTCPDDFPQEEMRGKVTRFEVRVKDVGKRLLPDLDKDFFDKLGVESAEDLKAKVKDSLDNAVRQESEKNMKRELLTGLVERSSFEIPDGLVNMGLDSMLKRYREEYSRAGEADIDAKIDEIRERLRPLAVNMVKEQFIVDEIAKREGVRVSDGEIEGILRSVAVRAGISIEEARKRAEASEETDRWRREMLRDKVLDLLLENADVKGQVPRQEG
jgi:trigger factor